MGKLNETTQVNTIGSEFVLLTDSNGLIKNVYQKDVPEGYIEIN